MAPFGTEEAIRRLVEEYSAMLLRLAATRLDSVQDAEDAVQDVFLKLLSAQPSFRDAGHEKAWLIRATLHRASDIRRRGAGRTVPLETAENAPARAEAPEGALLYAVRSLPPAYSAVLHLYYYEGYSIKEIAALLRLPAATVGTRLARGRERLRRILEEDE